MFTFPKGRKNDLLRKLERVLIMKKNVTVLQNNEVKMYEAPPDEKDVYIERLKKQGYNSSIINGTLTVKCDSRTEMEQLKEKIGVHNFSVGFVFPE